MESEEFLLVAESGASHCLLHMLMRRYWIFAIPTAEAIEKIINSACGAQQRLMQAQLGLLSTWPLPPPDEHKRGQPASDSSY
jgi:hypothetical protein